MLEYVSRDVSVVVIEWTVKEQQDSYLIIIRREVDQETDGGIVYKQILIDVKLKTGKRNQKKS